MDVLFPVDLPPSLRYAAALLLTGILTCFAGETPTNPYEAPGLTLKVPGKSAELDRIARPKAVPCPDAVFLRRVYLDLLGILPTREEAEAFLKDQAPEKRQALVDRVLERPEYADYWGMKWGDLLRIKSEFPVNLWPNAAQAYDSWIRTSLRNNQPYSDFARELITAAGSNFRAPQVNFLRAAAGRDPESLAASTARVFMGERIAGWPAERRADLAAFFARVSFKKTREWKEEILVVEPGTGPAKSLRLPDGAKVRPRLDADPRTAFADWLIRSRKSPFAVNGANRIWFWLFGQGLVHEPDDFRSDNPPSNPALLEWLGNQFAASGYDTKQLLRVILNSATYQEAPGGFYKPRRLEAEVLVDVINQVTGETDEYSSLIPEPFTFIPQGTKAVALPDGSITSSILELFGRPPRDTGLLLERPTKVTTSQRLQLLNSRYLLKKLEGSKKLTEALRPAKQLREGAETLYLTILSRYPTEQELKTVEAYPPPGKSASRQKFLDLAWALMNSSEFLMKH